MNKIIINVAAAASMLPGICAAQALQAPSLPTAITPGIIGNIVQASVDDKRIGSTSGIIGPQSTPATVIRVNVVPNGPPVQGSAATVSVMPRS